MLRFILCTLVLAFTTALAQAAIVDGRPGQFEFSTGSMNAESGYCIAYYAGGCTSDGNCYISGTGVVRLTENKNMVMAICKFTDTSGAFESNAEVGPITDCTLYDGPDTYVGSGKITAAANNLEGTGGNVTMKCTFAPLPD